VQGVKVKCPICHVTVSLSLKPFLQDSEINILDKCSNSLKRTKEMLWVPFVTVMKKMQNFIITKAKAVKRSD
jgi:hypothetical protein